MRRPLRPGSFIWRDRDDDVEGSIEAFLPDDPDPNIVATLREIVSAGIYIDVDQAKEMIDWLDSLLLAAGR